MSQGLKPTTDLSNRIAQIYPSLSNGHRRAADFVLQHPLDVATMTIEGLAEGSGTSNATVTRFVRALGYASYGEFRSGLSAALKFAHDPVDSFAGARSGVAAGMRVLFWPESTPEALPHGPVTYIEAASDLESQLRMLLY